MLVFPSFLFSSRRPGHRVIVDHHRLGASRVVSRKELHSHTFMVIPAVVSSDPSSSTACGPAEKALPASSGRVVRSEPILRDGKRRRRRMGRGRRHHTHGGGAVLVFLSDCTRRAPFDSVGRPWQPRKACQYPKRSELPPTAVWTSAVSTFAAPGSDEKSHWFKSLFVLRRRISRIFFEDFWEERARWFGCLPRVSGARMGA